MELRTAPSRLLTVEIDEQRQTSGLLIAPDDAVACYVLAHGAGAGMRHAFMEAAAQGLAHRRVATLRFQFPFMEAGSKRPDPPILAQATVRAAVALAASILPGAPLFAGGRSFGGRMTSQAQAEMPLPGVEGLIFLGFPLHPANKPAISRAGHLRTVGIPMLFIQGDRDALADLSLLSPILKELQAQTFVIEGGDHGFKVPARLRRTNEQVLDGLLDEMVRWLLSVGATHRPSFIVA